MISETEPVTTSLQLSDDADACRRQAMALENRARQLDRLASEARDREHHERLAADPAYRAREDAAADQRRKEIDDLVHDGMPPVRSLDKYNYFDPPLTTAVTLLERGDCLRIGAGKRLPAGVVAFDFYGPRGGNKGRLEVPASTLGPLASLLEAYAEQLPESAATQTSLHRSLELDGERWEVMPGREWTLHQARMAQHSGDGYLVFDLHISALLPLAAVLRGPIGPDPDAPQRV